MVGLMLQGPNSDGNLPARDVCPNPDDLDVPVVLTSPKLQLRYGETPPGDLITTRHHDDDGRVWFTIDRADPVILASHEILTDFLYRKRQPRWLLSWVRLTMAPGVTPWAPEQYVTRAPHFPAGRERDGSLTALMPDFHGARLNIYAANLTAVYVVTDYMGDLTWRAAWPE